VHGPTDLKKFLPITRLAESPARSDSKALYEIASRCSKIVDRQRGDRSKLSHSPPVLKHTGSVRVEHLLQRPDLVVGGMDIALLTLDDRSKSGRQPVFGQSFAVGLYSMVFTLLGGINDAPRA
jgi:hypothetical protein